MSKIGKQLSAWRLFLVALLLSSALPLLADSGDPSSRVARLGYIQGSVSVQPAGVDQWSQAEANYPVSTGDRLYTDQGGRDELSIGGTVIRMSQTTDLTMTNLSDQLTQLGLAQGTIRVRTFGLDPSQQVEIDTPNGAVTVVQPGDIRIDSYDEDGGTQVTVNTGAVQVTGPNLSQNIGAGESVRLLGTNPIELQQIAMPALDEFDQWSVQRDRHIQDARSAQYVSRYTPGYDDLDDYGTWDTGTEYGPVWYPREVPADWVPYRVGHWVWTGPWGWTWVESEPWGYAPFHYGRWAYIRSRWGWVPGPIAVRPIWSPALVAFAGGGGFSIGIGGVAAWFPLGVGEPYIPWYHCSSDYVRRVNVTNINIVNIHNTTIINNYNNFVHSTNNYTNLHAVNYGYANRERAFTAAPARVFASGQPIYRNVIHVNPEQVRTAQVIAHPSIQPTRLSVTPRPVAHALPVPAQRPTLLTRGGHQAQAVPGARQQPVPFHALPANGARGAVPVNRPGGQPTLGAQPTLGHVGAQPVNPAAPHGPTPAPVVQNRPGAQPTRPNAPGEGNVGARPLITRNGTTLPGRPAPEATPHGAPETAPRGAVPQNAPHPMPETGANNGHPAAPGRRLHSPIGTGNIRVRRDRAPQTRALQQPASPGRSAYQPRPLVTRNEPPGNQPSFQQQQRGQVHDPGRPLDPQQRQTVEEGRRPAPSQDNEYLPHAQPAPQQHYTPAPQQHYTPPAAQPQRSYSPPVQQQRNYAPPVQQQRNYAPPMEQRSAPAPQPHSAPEPRMEQHSAPSHSEPHSDGHSGGGHR